MPSLGRLTPVVLLCAGFALAGSAVAQELSCKPDIARLCPGARPGGGQIAECLRANAAQLSPGCRARVGEMKEILAEVDAACEEDVHFLCAGVPKGGGRIVACLKQNLAEVSPRCKVKLAEAKRAVQ
jgi:hypothetical protein